ncbi:hypothetical protein PZA11_006042 [Diplocarpon coronariae]
MSRPGDVVLTRVPLVRGLRGVVQAQKKHRENADRTRTGSPLNAVADRSLGRAQHPSNKAHICDGQEEGMDVEDPAMQDDRYISASPIPRVISNKSSAYFTTLERPPPRDVYNIEVSPHIGEGEDEIPANRAMERAQMAVKANESTFAPVTNTEDGEDFTLPLKRKRGRPRKDQLKDATSAPVSPIPAGRGGRPRKKQPEDAPVASSSLSLAGLTTAQEKLSPREDISKAGVQVPTAGETLPAAAGEQDIPQECILADEDYSRFTDILMNPSPIKPIQPVIKVTASGSHGYSRVDTRHEIQEVDEDISDESEHESSQDEREDLERDEIEFKELLVKEEVLAKMVEIANRAGCRLETRSGQYVQIVAPKILSNNGKRIIRRIDKLLEGYRSLRELSGSEDIKAKSEAEKSIQRLTLEVQTEAESILETRLGNPKRGIEFFDGVKTRKMLNDLYYVIIRRLVGLIHLAADIYPLARSIESSGLQRILTLVEILEDLASTALIQPKEFQPEQPSKSATHQIIRPTRHLMPHIRKIHESLTSERLGRERAARASGYENRSPQRKARRDDDARRKNFERDARRKESKEIRRLQREILERRKAEPVWGLMIVNDIVRKSVKATSRNEIRRQRPHSSHRDEESNPPKSIGDFDETQDDDDPFAEDDDEEYDRVSVFGKNNKNDRSRPLSAKEKAIFVECMMKERGEDRYEKAAEALERSMEDIFSFAQDLQEAMDRKHAEGEFNRASDGWTYDIWATPA